MSGNTFTFKQQPNSETHDIRLGGMVVGEVRQVSGEYVIKIRCKLKPGEISKDNNYWKWRRIKRRFASIDEAKDYTRNNGDKLKDILWY